MFKIGDAVLLSVIGLAELTDIDQGYRATLAEGRITRCDYLVEAEFGADIVITSDADWFIPA